MADGKKDLTVNRGQTVEINDNNRDLGTVTIYGDGLIRVKTSATISMQKLDIQP